MKFFINVPKYCTYHENDIKNKLAESMRSKNMLQFWKTVRNQENNLQNAANIVDGKDSNVEIANVFMTSLVPCLENQQIQIFSLPAKEKIMAQFPISNTLNFFLFLKF